MDNALHLWHSESGVKGQLSSSALQFRQVLIQALAIVRSLSQPCVFSSPVRLVILAPAPVIYFKCNVTPE